MVTDRKGDEMKAIRTRYFGPTNVRGSRIIADDGDRNRITVSYDHSSSNPHREAALALCAKMGWKGDLIEGGLGDGYVYVFAASERVANPCMGDAR